MQKKEGAPQQPPALGKAGVVEALVSAGRIPDFSGPKTEMIDGLLKKVVLCTVPAKGKGQKPNF